MPQHPEHPDDLPTREEFAKELLLHKMRQHSEDFYCATLLHHPLQNAQRSPFPMTSASSARTTK